MDGIEWTAEGFEQEIRLDKRTNKRSKGELLINVDLNVLLVEGRNLQIPFCVLGCRVLRGRHVPAIKKTRVQFISVEVTVQSPSPHFDGE